MAKSSRTGKPATGDRQGGPSDGVQLGGEPHHHSKTGAVGPASRRRGAGPSRSRKSDDGGDPTQRETLLRIIEGVTPFRSPSGEAFADIEVNGHRETWPIKSDGFKNWLGYAYYRDCQGAPGAEALQAALNIAAAKALYAGAICDVHVRVGELGERRYLDLCDEAWRAVEIDAAGWRIVDRPPVRFRCSPGTKPLPVPRSGGKINSLRQFLNVTSDADFILAVSWLLACLRNQGPYPVLVVFGEQGCAKSTFTALLRSLVDPNSAALRTLPRDDRELFIGANNSHILAFDNLSGIPSQTSDALCRIATGGAFAARRLYSDQDETLFDVARPIILNGIESPVTRPDLADRAIFLTLESIPRERRRATSELQAAFDAECPLILGALLDAVVEGLKRLPAVRLAKLPRMADFALWATACETALWPAETFMAAYDANRREAVEDVLEGDPLATAIRTFMAARSEWQGTASNLAEALPRLTGSRAASQIPENAYTLSRRLSRITAPLSGVGITITRRKGGRNSERLIRIVAASQESEPDDGGELASAPSVASAPSRKASDANRLAGPPSRTQDQIADARRALVLAASAQKAPHLNGADDTDDADAKFLPPQTRKTTAAPNAWIEEEG